MTGAFDTIVNGNPLHAGALFAWNTLKAGVFNIRDIRGTVHLFYNMIKSADKDKSKALDQVDLYTFLSRYTNNEVIHVMMDSFAAGSFGILLDEASTGETIRTLGGMVKSHKKGYIFRGSFLYIRDRLLILRGAKHLLTKVHCSPRLRSCRPAHP